jgi:hypothetical protein
VAVRFEGGDPDRPRGHALLYFRTTDDQVLATYVVVLPIAINPAKYIPPAFAGHLPQAASSVAATALPPIPESLGEAGQSPERALAEVRRLAETRGDDLLDGGVITPEPERLMLATHEVANEYAERYRAMIERLPPLAGDGGAAAGGVGAARGDAAGEVDEDALRWALLDARGDQRQLGATLAQIERLRRNLPEKYRIDEFLVAAQRPGDVGSKLAELYIDRCYKLANEQYETLADLDRQIEELENRAS